MEFSVMSGKGEEPTFGAIGFDDNGLISVDRHRAVFFALRLDCIGLRYKHIKSLIYVSSERLLRSC